MTSEDAYSSFRNALREALDRYQPGWDHRWHGIWREYRHQDWEQNKRFSVWVDTLRRWVRGDNFPRVRKFESFLEAVGFPDDTRDELHQLFHDVRQARRRMARVESVELLSIGDPPLPSGAPFIGRDEKLNALHELVTTHQFISLSGPPGIGKTALACQVMSRCAGTHHRIYLGSLHPDALFHNFSDLIAPKDRASAEAVWRSAEPMLEKLRYLAKVLAEVPAIILLDDLDAHPRTVAQADHNDHLMPLLSFVAGWPSSRLVITSQFQTSLPQEFQAYHQTLVLADGLSPAAGSQFLRMLDAADSCGLQQAPDHVLQSLVERVRGIPRILERVAGALKLNPLVTIEVMLSGLLDIDPIRQAIELSYEPLNQAHHEILGALAVFRGPVDMYMLAVVVDRDAEAIRQDVQYLVQAHLIQADRQNGLLWLHQLDREYWRHQGSDAQRNVRYRRAAAVVVHQATEENHAGLLINALQYYLAAADPVNAARLIDQERLRTIVKQGYSGLFTENYLEVVAALQDVEDDELLATVYYHLALAYRAQGQTEEALEALQVALRYASSPQYSELQARIQVNLGHVHRYTEAYQAAFDVYEAATTAQDPETQIWALLGLAMCRQSSGELAEAEQAAEQALHQAMRHRFTFLEGHSRQVQADLLHARGQPYAAINHLMLAVAISEQENDARSGAYRHCMLANWFSVLGAHDMVREHLEMAAILAEEAQDLQAKCTQQLGAAKFALWLGEESALDAAMSAHDTAVRLGFSYIERWSLVVAIQFRQRAGEDIMLPHLLPRLAKMFGAVHHVHGWQYRYTTLARFYLLTTQIERASDAIHQALRFPVVNHHAESLALSAIVAYILADYELASHQIDRARHILSRQLHEIPNLVLAQGTLFLVDYLNARLTGKHLPPDDLLGQLPYPGLRRDLEAIIRLL
ncbi:MAG: AAA family ATPase [Chloroflexi bacterium]|nr:AAA family ATPase [Chloroflexota bacterium]